MRLLAASAAALAALVAAGLAAAPARADADPPSDILLGQNVYYPFFGGRPSAESQRYLEDVVAAANDSGYQIKVAAVGNRQDLGGVFSLFGKPKQYAPFLAREIAFQYRGRLLTSMPAGFGFFWQGHPDTAAERRILDGVQIEPGLDGLVDSTAEAVKRLAAANGHTIDVQKTGGGGSSTSTRVIIGIGGALVLAAVLLVPFLLRRRRRAAA